MKGKIYCSYDDYAVIYDLDAHAFSCFAEGEKNVINDAQIIIHRRVDARKYTLNEFDSCEYDRIHDIEANTIIVKYNGSDKFKSQFALEFKLDRYGIKLTVLGLGGNEATISAKTSWGEDSFPICIGRYGDDIRTALGPAASTVDNALFDRQTDSAFSIEGGKKVRFRYNWEEKQYKLELGTGLVEHQQRFFFSVKKNLIGDEYGIKYSPINKNSTFKKAPVGWMTWYAVRFDAREKTVCENTEYQKKLFGDYGADTIWVDWEWYHKDFDGERSDGCDTFNPDKQKYPNGMKKVSEYIEEQGFIPSLWIGYTHDSSHNKYTKECLDMILKDKVSWCGRYFYDITHPKYLNEFLPEALEQVFDWGYKAVKFDTLPICIDYHEEEHMNMYNPNITTRQAFRNAMQKARDILGKDMYMLSCAAVKDADILWAADIFDAARVGKDIFEWNDFIKEGVMRTLKFYAMHNTVLYADPDNLIIREEFNNNYQAASRTYFVSMLGLPMTFGDNLPDLPDDRVNLIRNCLPVLDIHPMDIRKPVNDKKVLIINLAVEKPYESYNVVNLFNLVDRAEQRTVSLDNDLHLDEGEYLVFDFNQKQLKCITNDNFFTELKPCESRIFAVRKKTGTVQLISTSRHISQGAAEIEMLSWDENTLILTEECSLVKDEEYNVYLYVPEEYELSHSDKFNICSKDGQVQTLSYTPNTTGRYEFSLKFKKIK